MIFKHIVRAAPLLAALALVVVGRINTFHMTEGEAFIAGWPYWLAATAIATAYVIPLMVKPNDK